MANLAILAGSGTLPVMLAAARPEALCVRFKGVDCEIPGDMIEHRFEKMGTLFQDLHARGVTEVVLAGSLARPPLDPSQLDPLMLSLAPRLFAAMQGGDDGLLRLVISVIEEQGFTVRGAHEILPAMTADEGVMAGPDPTEADLADAAKAADILLALSPLDVGQGAIVAGGLCLGIETLQGTDALLAFAADTPAPLRPKAPGVLLKMPKRGQDLRVDMPAIGPATVAAAARAGLAGIVVAAGEVIVLDRAETLQAAADASLFILGRVP